MTPRKTRVLAAMITASLLWSTAGVVTKVLLQIFNPYLLAYIRFGIAAIFVLPFLVKNPLPKLPLLLRHMIPISILGALNVLFFYLGISRTTVNAASVIYTAQPLTVTLFAYLLIRESVTKRKLAGMLIGLSGVLAITLLPVLEKGQPVGGNISGNIMICLAIVCWSLYTIGSRHLMDKYGYSAKTLTIVSLFTSAALFGLVSIFVTESFPWVMVLRPGYALLILHLALAVTVVTYFLYQWSIAHSSATTASLVQYLQPVSSIGLAIIFLGERLSWGFLFGSMIVFAGVYIAAGLPLPKLLKR